MDINIINDFRKKTILVIGDIMVDKYVYGQTSRISPEAPVPVVKILSEENILGGAANTANNLASLGSEVVLIGVVGQDEEGQEIFTLLKKRNIDYSLILKDSSRPTTITN